MPLTKAVRADKLRVMSYAKLYEAEPGVTAAKISLRIQLAVKPHPSFANKTVAVGPEWKLVSMDGIADKNYAANAIGTAFQCNSAKHVIAIGPVAVFNQGR